MIFDINNANITANSDEKVDIDFSFFTSDDAKSIVPVDNTTDMAKSKKRKRVQKLEVDGKIESDKDMMNPVPGASVIDADYASSYSETNSLIRGAIMQADELGSEIKQDIDAVRSSKTLKNKYTYLTNLSASASALISTKIAAIKELNSTITQAHNLELNRLKALKLNETDSNDDMKMMDMYSAFINTPIGTYSPQVPNIQDLTLGVNSENGNVSAIEMVQPGQQFGNLTPEQNRMRMEANPNIQTVVRYDQSTGQRQFDVIDTSTGASIPNYPRPDNFLLEDTTIDVHAGIARNRNINTVWPLVINGSNSITEY